MPAANIKKAYATAEYTPEKVLELKKCIEDPIHFMQTHLKVIHPTKGTVPFVLYDYQIKMVEAVHYNKDVIILASRQLGKTTVIAMYILWFALFNRSKTCIIASKNMEHAVEIMARIKYAYEELPNWMKAGCKFFNRTSIEFDNASKIKCEATSERTGRGSSPAILIVDEIAFISKRIQDAMWSSLAPALSTGGKFILTSTPNGDTDLFASIWRGAMAGTNSFKPVQAMWHEHPERGEEYYQEMLGKLGELLCRQELDCEFLSSDALLINSIKLHQLAASAITHTDMGFKFWVPPESLGGTGKIYLVACDPATGGGKDFSVIEVFDFPGLNQVAEYRTNDVNIPMLYSKLKWILGKLSVNSQSFGKSEIIWTFERNGIGEAIAALYQNDENQPEYAELYCDIPGKLGIFTSNKTKVLSCLQLKQLVEKTSNGLKINSEQMLFELKNFVAKGGSYEAKQGATDDTVMATIGIVRLLKRLSEWNEDAFRQINHYVEPDEFGDEAVPFLV